jgi:hypothetical protein
LALRSTSSPTGEGASRLAGGIADAGREVADHQHGQVPQILEAAHLLQHHGVPQVDVGRGRIEARLDAQRLARLGRALELRLKLLATCTSTAGAVTIATCSRGEGISPATSPAPARS